ncbi:MAG: hypothetical protein IPI43_28845 [Sandaracinaceae bacterium]|nr:hypothetical protein [Sandaracinaceae bacterium]
MTVVDCVGNHKVFLERVRTLLSLGGRRDAVRPFLESDEKATLPEGCCLGLGFLGGQPPRAVVQIWRRR